MSLEVGSMKTQARPSVSDIAHDTATITLAVHVDQQYRKFRDALILQI